MKMLRSDSRAKGQVVNCVLCAVGVETLQQGDFHSLAVYLLVSSAGVMLLEGAYFLDALLVMCLPCPPGLQLLVLWGKMAHLGGFQKFLYYSIMSVVCFLHPVLVWHATIPGTMLLVTALFNFVLSKKAKEDSPKGESYDDQGPSTVCVTESDGPGGALSFFHVVTGRRGAEPALATREGRPGSTEVGESSRAMLELERNAPPAERQREWRRWRERRRACLRGGGSPVEREMEEFERCCDPEPDTTSDTAPMIAD
ncbi:transmembrane protein 72 [Lampris incognitus]|uniref:transmembrane protein 72 n=1 Tax=Lampris incognitus TaxID=2546036 RepID=UPI0024B5B035|nr:transmembrane protein 72 [Lampris incognitus]